MAREPSMDRSAGGSGHAITSTMSHPGRAALWAARKPRAWFWPKRSLACISTTRLGAIPASLKISVKYWTAFSRKVLGGWGRKA